MNEHEQLGYTYADAVIKGAWEQIKGIFENKFGKNWERNILVGRFGGTIFIGLREGSKGLNDEELKQLQGIEVDVDGVTHDVGFAEITAEQILDEDNAENIKQKIKKTVDKVFSEPGKDWRKKKVELFGGLNKNEIEIFSNKLKSRTDKIEESDIEDKNKRVNLELLLKYFFNEKRGLIRRNDFINEIPQALKSELGQLMEIFMEIGNGKQN
jgi:hypothetical protein